MMAVAGYYLIWKGGQPANGIIGVVPTNQYNNVGGSNPSISHDPQQRV